MDGTPTSTQDPTPLRLAAVGAVVGVLCFILFPVRFDFDSVSYWEYAQAWIRPQTAHHSVYHVRTPGYPLMLLLTGTAWLQSLWPLLLVQLGCAVAGPWLVYHTCARLDRKVAAFAAWTLMASLLTFIHMKSVMTESIFITLQLVLLLLWEKNRREGKLPPLLAAFALVAVLAAIRPAAALLVVPLGFVSLLFLGKHRWHLIPAVLVFVLMHLAFQAVRPADLKQNPSPGMKGQMLFFPLYLGMPDREQALVSGDLGPNSRKLVNMTAAALGAQPTRESLQDTLSVYYPANAPAAWYFYERYLPDPQALNEAFFQDPNRFYFYGLWHMADQHLGLVEAEKMFTGASVEIVKAHPGVALEIYLENFLHFTLLPPRRFTFAMDLQHRKAVETRHLFQVVGPHYALNYHPRLIRSIAFQPLRRLTTSLCQLFNVAWSTLSIVFRPLLFLAMCLGVGASFKDPRWRPLCWCTFLIALYHAAIVSVANEPLPRYIHMAMVVEFIPATVGLRALAGSLNQWLGANPIGEA